MKIIAGLGNPGKKYLRTRHNLGFIVIDHFVKQYNTECTQKKFRSLFCKMTIGSEDVVLLKPQTFMNLSGIAVKEALNMYKCAPSDVMIVCDDLDLPFSKIRIRRTGGCGGHRGLESVTAYLGNNNFARLRMGIGKDKGENASNFVLSTFSEEEETKIPGFLDVACIALKTWITEGAEVCMNKYN